MKIAPIYWAIMEKAAERFAVELVHTGQHYDASMSDDFFRDLALPMPSVNLGVGSGSHASQTAKVMLAFEGVVVREGRDSSGNYCREYQNTAYVNGQPVQTFGTACLRPDGSWQIVG